MKIVWKQALPFIIAVLMVLIISFFMDKGHARYWLAPTALMFIFLSALLYFAGGWTFEDHKFRKRDPWVMQRALMRASDQPLPSVPTLSKNSLMYVALILEESAETIRDGTHPALKRYLREQGENMTMSQRNALELISAVLNNVDAEMASASATIRGELKHTGDFAAELTLAEAVGTFDGTTDVTVVNCGFALASGLPGAEGYDEVGESNLSKRNPETGMIDKTPDGKWIKGTEFWKPDLERVLSDHMLHAGVEWPRS